MLLSPCKLTEGLKPLLTAASAPRVINIVSGGMYSQKLDVAALIAESESGYSGSTTYARQKRALMVLTEEWGQTVGGAGHCSQRYAPRLGRHPRSPRGLTNLLQSNQAHFALLRGGG